MTEMLQKTENVANNVANENSQDLTSQWKKGELPDGWYWVKKKTCEEYIDKVYFWSDTFIDGDVPLDNDKVIEVLAKVPSYEEYAMTQDCVKRLFEAAEKETILKEQLKIAVDALELYALEKMYLKNPLDGMMYAFDNTGWSRAKEALKQIKELQNA